MVKQTYETAIARVFQDEGGYTNDAADPGGPTNWGITIFDARMYWKPNASAADVRAMPKSVAEQIYRDKYAAVVQYDLLPAGVDYAVLDYGINSGVGRAAKVLQRLVGAPVDGKIGLTTVAATLKNDPADLVNRICDERMRFLRSLKTWPTFGRGWTSRVTGLRRAALNMVGKYPEPVLPPTPKAQPAPTETNQEVIEKGAKAPEEKPEIPTLPKSQTLWGGLVAWLGGMGGTIAGFFQYLNNPYTLAAFIFIVAVICVGGYFILTGRLNLQKKIEDLAARNA